MVYNKYKTVYRSGAKRYQYDKKTFSIRIFKDELVNVATLNCKILKFDHEKVLLEKKCKDLYTLLLKEQEISHDTVENLDKCIDQVDYLLS